MLRPLLTCLWMRRGVVSVFMGVCVCVCVFMGVCVCLCVCVCVCVYGCVCTSGQLTKQYITLCSAKQRVIKPAQKIIGCSLPPLEDIYETRCLRKAHSILRDSTHPGYHLFELLPSGRRFRTIIAKTDRLRN